ncbi:hypothetical protein BHE74_00021498 [Ensete ventricosum]|uniref:Uncharacterized protein n=1 Tax=Ensete ventricosum TaxID=4639 RepID=A0A426WZJ8_ENSVE|nr:hypothetical protein B296_00043215 [Ensete ventricosum]RWW16266.1 hypothetical protein GW17_00019863 [Ensete ventricosum]RWW70805.1 hypothetical protein BHE74_00021498 [Ensete ventricosum]RZS19502.1 hypothetical protein BHM03_00051894 [Ensete ventricosum]
MERTRDGDGPWGSGGSAAPALTSFRSPSPSSSSSSDFEFTVSLSPSSKRSCAQLCPADELFYKGQLLPLHLSPRISMVRNLLASASASSSSTDTTATASRDSNGSSSSASFSAANLFLPECDSSRPSSVTEDEIRRFSTAKRPGGSKYLSSLATRFSVFLHRGSKKLDPSSVPNSSVPAPPPPLPTKRANSLSSSSAKEVIKKYVKKVKPIYEKLSALQQRNHQQPLEQQRKKTFSFSIRKDRRLAGSGKKNVLGDDRNHARRKGMNCSSSASFSGNLLAHPTRKKPWAASCPSSMRSSPSHSGLLYIGGGGFPEPPPALSLSASSMEELQSAIQGAIAHCKSSMIQTN